MATIVYVKRYWRARRQLKLSDYWRCQHLIEFRRNKKANELMAKPKIPNQKKKYQELNGRLNGYVSLVEQIYDTLNLEAAKSVSRTKYSPDSDKPFKWSDYPQTKKQIDDIQAQFVDDIHAAIYRGTSEEWKNSNEAQDLIANKVLRAYNAQVDKEKYKVLYQTNSDALKAFQNRKDKGLNISAKLWQQSMIYKEELEAAISCAIQKGTSAVTLSKQISKYLLDFPLLQKDYKDRYGSAEHIQDCEYRSIRLARSEINMAYRTAENERWKQMDFVVGYEIKLSSSHHSRMPHGDICDTLAGKYPKDFTWTGWHPNDLCYKVPILKTEEEFWEWDGRIDVSTESINEVKDVPDEFKKWVLENQQKIEKARKRNTLPYFLRDNKSIIQNINTDNSAKELVNRASLVGNEVQSLAESIAKKHKGFVTPINYKSISSITRKVTTESITPYDIKDAVRTTIIVPKSQIDQVLNELSESDSFVRLKRQKPESFMGYSGNIVNIQASNGLIAEIQVNTDRMIYAKEKPEDAKRILGEKRWKEIQKQTGMKGGLGHKYYEEWRVLDKADKKAQKIAEKSIEYYSHFQ
nr:MAG TPA: Tas1 [Caudoviricetes sp.]